MLLCLCSPFFALLCKKYLPTCFCAGVEESASSGKSNRVSVIMLLFSHYVMPDSQQTHGWQCTRPPGLHPLPELTQTHVHQVVMPSSHLVFCRPLLLLPSIFSRFTVFSSESILCIGWPEYWTFSFSISPSNEYSGLISFRIDWLDLLAVQGTLKSLL